MTQDQSNVVVLAKKQDLDILRGQLGSWQQTIADVLPRILPVEKFVKAVLTAATTNPVLLTKNRQSFLISVMQAAQLGLEPNTPLNHAYLIPYKDIVTLQIGYKGLIELASRDARIAKVESRLVYSKDFFQVEYGNDKKSPFTHRPDVFGDRGEMVGVYAVATMADGVILFEPMSRDEVNAVRERSAGYRNKPYASPWTTDTGQMWRKTAIKRLLSSARLSPELHQAAELDSRVDAGIETVEGLKAALPLAQGEEQIERIETQQEPPAPLKQRAKQKAVNIHEQSNEQEDTKPAATEDAGERPISEIIDELRAIRENSNIELPAAMRSELDDLGSYTDNGLRTLLTDIRKEIRGGR